MNHFIFNSSSRGNKMQLSQKFLTRFKGMLPFIFQFGRNFCCRCCCLNILNKQKMNCYCHCYRKYRPLENYIRIYYGQEKEKNENEKQNEETGEFIIHLDKVYIIVYEDRASWVNSSRAAVAFSIDATGCMLQMLYNITFTREPILQFSHFPPTIFNDVFLLLFFVCFASVSFELGEKYHRLVDLHTIL